jgi:hypothetical protein
MSEPTGWEKPWSFKDEIELWRIPADQQAAAFQYELWRERVGLEELGRLYGGSSGEKPWLALRPDEVEFELWRFAFHSPEPPAVQIAEIEEAKRALQKAEGREALHLGYVPTRGDRKDSGQMTVDPEGVVSGEGLIVALKIDPEQGRDAVRAGFAKILKQLEAEIPRGSGSPKQSDKNLRGLAVLRAKSQAAPGSDYMRRFFSSTQYAGTVADQKTRLREIKKLVKAAGA